MPTLRLVVAVAALTIVAATSSPRSGSPIPHQASREHRREARALGADAEGRRRQADPVWALASRARHRWRHDARHKSGDVVPFQPWAETLFKERHANDSRDDPTASCVVGGVPRSDFVGYPFKILERPEMVVILYEAVHSYRQIFTDGRTLPEDPNPAWFGYSVGRWDGDSSSSSRVVSTTTCGSTTQDGRRRSS